MRIEKYKILIIIAMLSFICSVKGFGEIAFGNLWMTPCQMTVTTQHNNVTCHGGSNAAARGNVSGGTAPYTYSWSPGGQTRDTATGLSAGTYTITVTDHNGCTATASATITQPTAVTVSFTSHIDDSCYGRSDGSGTASASGGTPGTPVGYTYVWSPIAVAGATQNNLSAGTYTVTATDSRGCTGTATITITQPTVLTGVITEHGDISCHGANDGYATVNGSGGTLSYTFSWSPGGSTSPTITALSAGTYTATVTDANGCTATVSTTITEPSATLTASITSHTDVSCHGGSDGSATVGASGGTTSYTYSWSPSGRTSATATGLTAGSYTVTVTDAHGCTATASVTLTQPETSLSANITAHTDIDCHGDNNGSATVSASGGTGSYTYSWSPSGGTSTTASGLTAGTYTVTVTDAHGCTITTSVTLTQPATLTVSIESTNVSCNGASDGSATADPGGGTTDYTYSWAPDGETTQGITGLSPGIYTVTVTDAHGCTATASVTITQPEAVLNASITDSTNISCNGGENGSATVTATGGTASYTYSWSNGATSSIASGLTAGTYFVNVTDAHGCTATASVTLTEPDPVTAFIGGNQIDCYGFSDGAAIAFPSGGTPGYSYVWAPGGQTTQTITGLGPGTYTVTITDTNGCTGIVLATITQPAAPLTAAVNVVNAGCSGDNGTATVGALGGTMPYFYSWSTGATTSSITGLTAGTYTVTVRDVHNCTATASGTVGITNNLAVSLTTTPTCGDGNTGSAIATAVDGTLPYTYSWSPGSQTTQKITGLSAGMYIVTVTDAGGCTAIDTAIISTDTTPSVTITPSPRVVAYLQYSTLTASVTHGTAPFTYSWSGPNLSATSGNPVDAQPLTTSVYTVTVTDAAGCSAMDTVTIFVNPPAVETPTSCDTCIGGLNLIPGKTYVISIWAKESSVTAGAISYTNPQVKLVFPPGDSTAPFSPSGNIIDGWQRIEGQFTVPALATVFQIKLSCLSGDCNFDDIRVFPFNGTLKTYVYDPITLRLAAVLDERNYATIYEYDEEGKLIRVKKETERGVMTIQESRTAMKKQ